MKKIALSFLVVLAFCGIAVAGYFFSNRNHHRHCITATGIALLNYAWKHSGTLPFSEHGYSDALLELVRGGSLTPDDLNILIAPGGSTSEFEKALAEGRPPSDSDATRVYVQGLKLESNFPPDLLILFDRNSNYGDHFGIFPFCLFRPKVREAIGMAGSLIVIPDNKWPEVVENNVRYLKERGFSDLQISHYYDFKARK